MSSDQTRTYQRATSVVFLKTNEAFGGLSNMAGGFTLLVNGVWIRTSEALYQACRFPHLPEVQRLIIEEKSPMTAKMKSKPYRRNSRADWDRVRVNIMRWCLRVKLAQNWRAFSELLLETADKPIVEQSRKDGFWGAKPTDERTLVGMNVLGRLLMELREAVKVESRDSLLCVQPLAIPEFMLSGRLIEIVTAEDAELNVAAVQAGVKPSRSDAHGRTVLQASLFDVPVVNKNTRSAGSNTSTRSARTVDLKPYPAMKDSGVEWLGEVPEHWTEKRAKYFYREVDERSATGDEELMSVSHKTGVTTRKQSVTMFMAETNVGHKICRPNDIAINTMWAFMGALGVAPQVGLVSPSYGVYRPTRSNELMPEYIDRLLRIDGYKSEYMCRSTGINSSRLRLYPDEFLRIPIVCPPLLEQAAIVRYLDHVDRRVRRLVRAKRKLIALLTEQKQAIIHRAVTRGLDPDVPLKDSGVEWLGQVPEHWEVRRLFQACDVIDPHPSHRNPPLVIDGIPFLGVGDLDIDGEVVKVSHRVGSDVLADQNARFIIEEGALAIGRVASVGKVVRLRPGNICLSGRLAVLKPKIGSGFLFYCLGSRSTQHQITLGTDLTTMGVLGLNKLKRIYLCVPPVDEQSLIVKHIDKVSASIDPVVTRTHLEIELLNEYRTRLIADVVTGKLDVREAAAALPEVDPLAAHGPDEALDTDTETDFDELSAIPEEAEA